MDSDVDIGTLPKSEWQFSVRHIFFRYRNNRRRCRMSDIADIEVDVDAHLCRWTGSTEKFAAMTDPNSGRILLQLKVHFPTSHIISRRYPAQEISHANFCGSSTSYRRKNFTFLNVGYRIQMQSFIRYLALCRTPPSIGGIDIGGSILSAFRYRSSRISKWLQHVEKKKWRVNKARW
jgi:hypothetical protein